MDLVSDEDYDEPNANEVEEDAALGDKLEKGTAVDDGPSEQATMPPNPPLST